MTARILLVEDDDRLAELTAGLPMLLDIIDVNDPTGEFRPPDEAELRAAGGYEFWSRVNAETDRRRRMRTPTPIAGAIMAAIQKTED